MFRRRGWLAVSAIWIILALQDPATGGVLYSGKNPRGIISRENRIVGQENVGKNSWTLTERNGQEIYMNQLELGSSQVSGPTDTLGLKVGLGSRKSRIKKSRKNEGFFKLDDFHSSGLKFEEEKLPYSTPDSGTKKGRANGDGGPPEAKKYAEHKWQISQVGSPLNEVKTLVQRGKRDTPSFDQKKLNRGNSRRPRYEEDDSKSNKYEEPTLISDVASEPASIRSEQSYRLHRKSFEPGNEKAYLSVVGGGEKLRDRSRRVSESGMVEDDDESEGLGVSDKKMQPHERLAPEEKIRENKVEKELEAREESIDFITAVSGKAEIVGDGEPMGESFNDSNAETGSTKNISSDSYGVSDNQRKVKNNTSTSSTLGGEKSTWLSQRVRDRKKHTAKGFSREKTTPLWSDLTMTKKNDDYSISGSTHRTNIKKGESGPSENRDELNADSQEAIKCIGKTKFNKKLPIGLSAVNYAGYIETERSDSNIKRNPVPKHKIEESYRRTDVARDMRREGDAAVAVANELAYSDTGFNAAQIPESVVQKIGVNDYGEIGLISAPVSVSDISGSLISHTTAVAIQSESHGIRESSDSQLIKDELLTTSWEEIHPRGEINDDELDDLLQADGKLSAIGEMIAMKNLDNKKFEAVENRDIDSRQIIGGDNHVQRKSLRKIPLVYNSEKENEHLGIIETLNGDFLRGSEKETVNEDKDRNEMTTTLNIRAMGTVGNSWRYKNEKSKKKPRDIRVVKSSPKINAAEISEEENLSNVEKGGNGSPRIRIPNFLANQRDADIETTRPEKTELLNTEPRGYGNDTDEFQFIVPNSGPIQGGKIERNEDVEGGTIDVEGKSSGNLLSEIRGDGKVIRNSKFIVQNSEKLQDKVNRDENSLLTVIKIDKTFGIEDTRAKVTGKQVTDSINLPHVSPRLFQSYTEGNTAGYTEININTSPGRTAMTEPSARNGITQGLSLTVNLLAGKKNDAKLRGEVNRGGTVSRTMGKKKTNLLDKLLGSKPEVGNLSALDISGYGGYLTERIYFEVDTENNDRDKLPKKIAARPEVLVVQDKEKQTFPKLKQSRKFPVEISDDTEVTTPKFLQAAIPSDKYLASKNKRAMKTSGHKINPEFTDEKMTKEIVGAEGTTVSLLKNLEDEASKAGNVSVEEILIAVNKSETSTETVAIFSHSKATGRIREDLPAKFTENNTRLFSRSFRGASESGTTTKNSVQSVQLFPENGEPVSGTENSYQFDNSTEMNVFSVNRGPIFDDRDNAATENPAFSDLQTIGYESNQTYSNDVNDSIATLKVLEVLTPLNSDLVDQDILSYFPSNLIPTEIPLKTTLDIFEAIAQSFNPPFNFNQTDLENTSRVSTALNQWPVKHSAVVEGDLVLGGLMMVHEREDSVTCGPVMPQGGVQALEAMLYTLDRLNQEEIIPGVKIGAHILDDCDKDTYGLEMAVDFIKGSISNIDGAEYHCNKTAIRKVISGVVGAASSVTSIQVANLLRLFRIPQVSFFSTSPELSNKQRFEYFTRTIPSDHYQVKAMVDIVKMMNWSYVSIIYEESNYGIKAFEELEELLSKYDICIAIKEKLVKDSGVAEETAYDNIVQKLLTKPRARGCIIFGSDQEVAGVMRAVRRCNATGAFSWIGSDGWSARGLVSDGNEPEVEGTLSVQPQANPVKGFEKYFLDLTVENNRRNPWFVEFWEDHFQCRYPNASWTPYNQKYTKPCTTKERLSKQNTAFEDQLQFVSDAVTAFAYAFRDMHRELCFGKPGLCDAMKPTKGTELLKYLRKVDFEGLSGDKFRFDKNGDGPARYNIIHFKQASPGKYKWVRVGEYMEGELRLNRSEIQFRLGHPLPPESVCSLPCEVGQAKKYVEGESCCWHCFNCTQYQVRHPLDETQCIPCPKGSLPDETHSDCRDIPEEFLRPESGWAIGAMSFSATGILVTLFVGGVFLRHNDTPVVRASGRELSYVLLTGILLCYLVTFALVLRPNNIVCGIQRFGAGFCFTVVYAALLTKTNRISRIFNAGKQSAKRPSFISPRSQLIICSGLMGIQILINGVWMIIDPAKAMYHYPTREDNLLVCSSYIDASYMIAFSYPIILIVVCTVYAVLTRKIPEAFNESKHIGFTMYTTCVIWLAFVPLYFGTGNHVALRITSMSVTISLSASVTIACLFSPKLYIILIRPERNVRQSMMPARYSTTKSSAVTGTNASSMMAAVTLTAATCDQNKAVKRHVTTTIDCSTQSEHYEMEVKEDRINGKTTGNYISRSTQTQVSDSADTNPPSRVAGIPISITKDNITSKEIIKDSTGLQGKQLNNVRIGNGPVSQKDGAL